MSNPKISVCIPTYNANENLLRRAINRILEQSFLDLELIIVNDGSTNNTKDIILSYEDKRIRYFENETPHGGPAFSRNIALDNSQGEYIFFHDHDDFLYTAEALEKMYSSAKEDNLDVLIFETVSSEIRDGQLNEGVGDLGNLHHKSGVFNCKDNDLLLTIFHTGSFPIWNKLLRTEFLKDNNLRFNENLKLVDDMEIYYRYILIADRIKVLHEPLYYWFQNDGSLLTKSWILDDLQVFKIIENIVKNLGQYEQFKMDLLGFKLAYWERFLRRIKEEDFCKLKRFVRPELEEANYTYEEICNLSPKQKSAYYFFI